MVIKLLSYVLAENCMVVNAWEQILQPHALQS